MKKFLSAVFLLGMVLYATLPAHALELREAFELAVKNHEAVLIARESIAQSEFGIDKAFSNLLPTVTVEGTYTRFSEKKTQSSFLLQPEDSTLLELRLEQSIYSGGKSRSFLRQARKKLIDSKKGLDEVREEIIIFTARAYYGVLKATREVEIQEASLKRAKEQRRVAEARFKAGAATKSEVLRAGAEVAGIEAELTRAGSLLKDVEDLLRRLTGLEGPIEVSTPESGGAGGGGGPVGPVEDTVEEYVLLAKEKRKDYQRLKIAEEIASEGITFAKGSFMPTVSLEGIFRHREQSPSTAFVLKDTTFAGLTIRFPIFEGGLRSAELGEARSKLREAELTRLELKREIELEVRTAYNVMLTAASVIDSFRDQLSFAEENYNMVFKQFSSGFADSLDVIDADTTLVSAERGLMRATFDYELAILELLKTSGLLLEDVEKRTNKPAPVPSGD